MNTTTKLAFEPHKISKAQFRPIDQHVIVMDMNFEYRVTTAGIILPSDDKKSSGIRPRWAQIYAVGPNQQDPELVPGKFILVAHGRWTRGIQIEDETGKHTIRRVDINDILCVSDEPMVDETESTAV